MARYIIYIYIDNIDIRYHIIEQVDGGVLVKILAPYFVVSFSDGHMFS